VPDDVVPAGWPVGFGTGTRERRALFVLSAMRGIKPRDVHRLAWREGTAHDCLRAIARDRAGSPADREFARDAAPRAIEQGVTACGARLVTPADQEYVAGLGELHHDPPAALYVRGHRLDLLTRAIAVVGARRCSSLGAEVAFDLGLSIAGVGCTHISGAARGIDSASHRGALAARGRSVAVLGSGIDVAYPRGSSGLLDQIQTSGGAIISEYAPGTPAEPFRFPARNRLIVALSRALVVVEGAQGSGSMISADHALEMGRDVFAVPGPVTSPLSAVPLAMIRDGATLIRGADDLLGDLGIHEQLHEAPPPDLQGTELRVWDALLGRSLPDAIARAAGLSIPDAVSTLIGLELRGLVRAVGGRYERRLLPRELPDHASRA
jgi:DNA processing protein